MQILSDQLQRTLVFNYLKMRVCLVMQCQQMSNLVKTDKAIWKLHQKSYDAIEPIIIYRRFCEDFTQRLRVGKKKFTNFKMAENPSRPI